MNTSVLNSNVHTYESEMYNVSKFQILSAVFVLNQCKWECTSATIQQCTLMNLNVVCRFLHRYSSYGLLGKEINNKRSKIDLSKNSLYKYSLTKKGSQCLSELNHRFQDGKHLHLKQKPRDADYTKFVLLPGLSDELKEELQKG